MLWNGLELSAGSDFAILGPIARSNLSSLDNRLHYHGYPRLPWPGFIIGGMYCMVLIARDRFPAYSTPSSYSKEWDVVEEFGDCQATQTLPRSHQLTPIAVEF